MLQQSDSVYLGWPPRSVPESRIRNSFSEKNEIEMIFSQISYCKLDMCSGGRKLGSFLSTPALILCCRAVFSLAFTVSTDILSLPHTPVLWAGEIVRITQTQTQIFLYLGKYLDHYRKKQRSLRLSRNDKCLSEQSELNSWNHIKKTLSLDFNLGSI